MIRVEPLVPGPLRQWWWRTTQRTRLGILGGVTVLVMALTGMALFSLPHGDAPRSAASPPSTSSSEPADRPSTTTAPAAADLAVTVTDVPAVDLVTGEDATRRLVQIKVAGIAPMSTCRTAEVLSAAAELLRGKQIVVTDGRSAVPDQAGRLVAPVVLPDGRDYAQAAVGGGLARTDPNLPAPNAGDLTAAEAAAQQTEQGAWRPCSTEDGTDSVAGDTTGSGPTDAPGQQPPGADPPNDDPQPPTTETTPPDDDDDDDNVQWGVREGDPCAPEGAVGVTHRGERVVCRDGHHGHHDGLRWRRR